MRRTLLSLTAALAASTGFAFGQDQPSPSPMLPSHSPATVIFAGAPTDSTVQQLPAGPASSPAQSCLGCQQGCSQQPCCSWKVNGWLAGDFLLGFAQGQPLPAGLITSPAGTVLAGGRTNYGLSYGFRVEAGVWLNSDQTLASQGIFDQLFRTWLTTTAPAANVVTSAGPIPVTNVTFQEWIQFNRADGNTWIRIASSDCTRIYGIIGTKFVSLEEDVNLHTGTLFEDFHTRDAFIGANVGVVVQYNMGRLDLDGAFKVGLGMNSYTTTILSTAAPAGILASATNIGYFENTVFSAVPEFNLGVSYRVTERISARFGYTFLAFSNVQRAGTEVTQTLGGSPYTPARETFLLNALNFGAIFRY